MSDSIFGKTNEGPFSRAFEKLRSFTKTLGERRSMGKSIGISGGKSRNKKKTKRGGKTKKGKKSKKGGKSRKSRK
jgi:hypothetical protein